MLHKLLQKLWGPRPTTFSRPLFVSKLIEHRDVHRHRDADGTIIDTEVLPTRYTVLLSSTVGVAEIEVTKDQFEFFVKVAQQP